MPRSVDTTVQVLPSGVALATGLAIAEPVGAPSYDQAITWRRTTDGAVVAELAEFDAGSGDRSLLASVFNPGNTGDQATLTIRENPAGGQFTEVTADVSTAVNGAFFARIINGLGQSSFPQLSRIQVLGPTIGPLPVSWTVNVKSPTVVVAVFGSGFLNVNPTGAGFPVLWDGGQVSGIEFAFSTTQTHQEMHPAIFIVTGQTVGNHTLGVNASGGNIITNNNDRFTAIVLN